VASAVCRAFTEERRQKGNFGRGKIAFLPKKTGQPIQIYQRANFIIDILQQLLKQ